MIEGPGYALGEFLKLDALRLGQCLRKADCSAVNDPEHQQQYG
jgi:hypothetical protein